MDPEQTFLRVHARLSGMLAQLLGPRVRSCLEYVSLGVAIALLGLLMVMHVNFVAQPGCASELSGSNIIESQLVQIKITSSGLWSQKISEQSQQASQGAAHSPSGKKTEIPHSAEVERSFLIYGRDSIRGAVSQILSKWYRKISAFYKRVKHLVSSAARVQIAGGEKFLHPPRSSSLLAWKSLDSVIVEWIDRRSKASEPTYLYTVEKYRLGFVLKKFRFRDRDRNKVLNLSGSSRCKESEISFRQ